MDNSTPSSRSSDTSNKHPEHGSADPGSQTKITIALSAAVIILLAIVVGGGYFLLQPETDTAKWRDALIVALSVELFVLGTVSILLIIQLARLVNLVQNEVRPLLESANETMNTVRGTANFLSANLVSPVVKVNSYMAAARKLLSMVNIKI